ncbi:hypothetical protein QVD17_04705 [Tagetes erecta]|uniref:BHLH domain-containing protein n=1 Tax=Tagetes erecta TaxID=13708 RepID=A0AAD8LG08_TARER|nr:hypothetical protein QVD17_04705 [Tagetes erecta]
MDFFFHYRNPNFQSSSSSSILLTNTKSSNNTLIHGNQLSDQKKMMKKKKMMSRKLVKLSTDPQSVAARERRHRISEKLKVLRSLIPGGDTRNLDTVSMLEEAIQYVKYLKSQIWLHQTMITFQNDDFDQQHPTHDQDLHDPTSDHLQYFYDHEIMLPQYDQLGFADQGSSFKLQDESDYNMVSLSHHHHHHLYQ